MTKFIVAQIFGVAVIIVCAVMPHMKTRAKMILLNLCVNILQICSIRVAVCDFRNCCCCSGCISFDYIIFICKTGKTRTNFGVVRTSCDTHNSSFLFLEKLGVHFCFYANCEHIWTMADKSANNKNHGYYRIGGIRHVLLDCGRIYRSIKRTNFDQFCLFSAMAILCQKHPIDV